jgi:TctA family transporter
MDEDELDLEIAKRGQRNAAVNIAGRGAKIGGILSAAILLRLIVILVPIAAAVYIVLWLCGVV